MNLKVLLEEEVCKNAVFYLVEDNKALSIDEKRYKEICEKPLELVEVLPALKNDERGIFPYVKVFIKLVD